MELLRLGAVGEERPYVRAADGTVHDLSSVTAERAFQPSARILLRPKNRGPWASLLRT